MKLCYAGCSAPSAQLIADEDEDIQTVRSNDGDINWGRERANTALNPDISNVTDKHRMRQLFHQAQVPMPPLVSISDLRSDLARGIPRKVVGRPDKHKQGKGFWLITSERELNHALSGTRKKLPATHFMDFIDAPREYRVHVFKGKSLRISEKKFFIDDDGKREYTTAKPQHNIKHVRKAAKKALKAVGIDFGAVDILADDENCWVLEVNAAPGLGGSMPRVYANAFRRWFEGRSNGSM